MDEAAVNGKRILITGGAGFLGSHLVRHALRREAARVTNVDLLTYAGDLRRLTDIEQDPRYEFSRANITSIEEMRAVLASSRPYAIVHCAAESHVTRSESAPDRFWRTNVEGTRIVLEAAVAAGVERFVHISSDEVYGPILEGAFEEEGKLSGDVQATSLYARSKALAEDLARSYADRLAMLVVRPTNAFGPHQFPEKVFPRWVTRALRGEPIPVWGDGLYIRQWLYADDFAEAIFLLLEAGRPGEVYNVGPRHAPEITNLALARWLTDYLGLPQNRVRMTVYDRPNHDRRYAVNSAKIRALGWAPDDVWRQLARTVEWYRTNAHWWGAHLAEAESIYMDAAGVKGL